MIFLIISIFSCIRMCNIYIKNSFLDFVKIFYLNKYAKVQFFYEICKKESSRKKMLFLATRLWREV